MSFAIYLRNGNDSRLTVIYNVLREVLIAYCPTLHLPKDFSSSSSSIFFQNQKEIKNLETKIKGTAGMIYLHWEEFLADVMLVSVPRAEHLESFLGFTPVQAISFLTYSGNEPSNVLDGSFARYLVKEMKNSFARAAKERTTSTGYIRIHSEIPKDQFCIVLMNNPNKENWTYLNDL